jgi:hypothetical protein
VFVYIFEHETATFPPESCGIDDPKQIKTSLGFQLREMPRGKIEVQRPANLFFFRSTEGDIRILESERELAEW